MRAAAMALREMLLPMGLYDLSPDSFVSRELEAYGVGFALVEEVLRRVAEDSFVTSCSGEALSRWEFLLGLPTQPEVPLESRRETVLARLAIRPGDFTLPRLEQSVSGAGVKVKITENPPQGALSISFVDTLLEYENWEQLKKQIQALLPAHLPAEFDVGILTWEMFDGFSLSFTDWDSADFSWQWFDINGHKLGKEGQHA
ncbi:YmfQ family protein [Phocea massiliensis]|nr:putative phage tail protein [Merdimmobilis hominis]MCD4835535.1 YmfQ family protein [Merdimmobilis hominis]